MKANVLLSLRGTWGFPSLKTLEWMKSKLSPNQRLCDWWQRAPRVHSALSWIPLRCLLRLFLSLCQDTMDPRQSQAQKSGVQPMAAEPFLSYPFFCPWGWSSFSTPLAPFLPHSSGLLRPIVCSQISPISSWCFGFKLKIRTLLSKVTFPSHLYPLTVASFAFAIRSLLIP